MHNPRRYEHALAVDVADLERNHFASAQTRPIGHAQRRLVLEPRRRIEQPRYLLWTEHHRQLARLTDERRVLDDVVSLERDPEKEPQRGHRVIENRRLRTVLGKMQLKAPHLLQARPVGRAAEKRSKGLDRADIAFLRLRR